MINQPRQVLGSKPKRSNLRISQSNSVDALKARMEKLWNYEKKGAFQRRDFTYYYKNNGLQNQSVLYRKDAKGTETVFLDPNTFSKDGTTSLGGLDFPKTVQK
jgi:prolyl oligopeptidase